MRIGLYSLIDEKNATESFAEASLNELFGG